MVSALGGTGTSIEGLHDNRDSEKAMELCFLVHLIQQWPALLCAFTARYPSDVKIQGSRMNQSWRVLKFPRYVSLEREQEVATCESKDRGFIHLSGVLSVRTNEALPSRQGPALDCNHLNKFEPQQKISRAANRK